MYNARHDVSLILYHYEAQNMLMKKSKYSLTKRDGDRYLIGDTGNLQSGRNAE